MSRTKCSAAVVSVSFYRAIARNATHGISVRNPSVRPSVRLSFNA